MALSDYFDMKQKGRCWEERGHLTDTAAADLGLRLGFAPTAKL